MNWKPIKSYDYLVVHCAATKASMDIGAEEIRLWHRQRGWFDIGYHYVIRRDGSIENGRPITRPGAHARGFNHISLGICLVGGVAEDGKTPEDNFTPEQYATLYDLLTGLLTQYPDANLVGHRDLPNVNKACPSFDVNKWFDDMLEEKANETEPRTDSITPPEDGTVVVGSRSCRFVPNPRPAEED